MIPSSRNNIGIVPVEALPGILPFCWHLLEPALKHAWNGMDKDYVCKGLAEGKMQLWLIGDDAALVSYVYKPFDRVICRLLLAGGKGADEWSPQVAETLLAFAADNGCEMLEVYGRPGWRKQARRTGFEHECSVFTKRIQG